MAASGSKRASKVPSGLQSWRKAFRIPISKAEGSGGEYAGGVRSFPVFQYSNPPHQAPSTNHAEEWASELRAREWGSGRVAILLKTYSCPIIFLSKSIPDKFSCFHQSTPHSASRRGMGEGMVEWSGSAKCKGGRVRDQRSVSREPRTKHQAPSTLSAGPALEREREPRQSSGPLKQNVFRQLGLSGHQNRNPPSPWPISWSSTRARYRPGR